MERWGLLFLLAVKLALFPEALEGASFFAVLESAVAVNLAIQPLTVVFIAVLIDDPSSSAFLALGELALVKVPPLYYFNPCAVLGYSSFLVLADSSEIHVSLVVIDDGFGDWHQWEDQTIFVFFNGEGSVFSEAIVE